MDMKYLLKFKTFLFAIVLMVGVSSCTDFLDRPDQASYTLADFYKTDQQLQQAANILYSSPWYDFIRGFIGVGDSQAGNHYSGGSPWWLLNHNSAGIQADLSNMSAALWSVNARANTTIENINRYSVGQPGVTDEGRNAVKGEVLVWKAMAYFYLVRIFGSVPIVHDNTKMMADKDYNTYVRTNIDDVYKYIILTLEQAIEWLPDTDKYAKDGRIDKYAAYGLLAKVYLTKSGYGQTGSRSQEDLDKAKEYAGLVVNNSGRVLEPEYSDIFRSSNDLTSDESLIAWRWVADPGSWTAQNSLQSDLGMAGFDPFNPWGDWTGPSVDLQMAFGEDATKMNTRVTKDKRRKATMMMNGDVYEYFWRDHPTVKGVEGDVSFPDGFDYGKFRREVAGAFAVSTGANAVKHLVGNHADHRAEEGIDIPASMCYGNDTHILRLADIYLVYAEAILGNSASTSDAEALKAFNAVRTRAGVDPVTSFTFDDVFKERRLELAYEGDNWYDFVRLSYYDQTKALSILNNQKRMGYTGMGDWLLKGEADIPIGTDGQLTVRLNTGEATGQPFSADVFQVPFPDTDVQMNPNMADDAPSYPFDWGTEENPTITFE